MNIMKVIAIPFVMLSIIGLAACETVEGAGKDIENAGESIQDAAD